MEIEGFFLWFAAEYRGEIACALDDCLSRKDHIYHQKPVIVVEPELRTLQGQQLKSMPFDRGELRGDRLPSSRVYEPSAAYYGCPKNTS